MLIRYPCTVIGNKELLSRIQRPYKIAKFDIIKVVILPKIIFLAWHFFMHMLNTSILFVQSIMKLQ